MKKALKYIGIGFGILLLAILYFVFLHKADLRTEIVKNDPQPIEGRALLMKMAAAHNIALWDSVTTYTVVFQDEFFGTMGQNSHPFPSSQQEMVLDFIPNSYNGRISFPEGNSWGIQSWKTYIKQKGGQPTLKEDKDIYFWIPTYQYFIELPLRIQTATAVSYAGEKTINGKACKGIFCSWGKYKPQGDIDQYLIWVDAETNMIHRVEYTIREMFGFLVGQADYTEYKTFDGIPLQTKMPVESSISSDMLHQMGINGVQFDMIPKDDLLPFKDLKFIGDAKEGQEG